MAFTLVALVLQSMSVDEQSLLVEVWLTTLGLRRRGEQDMRRIWGLVDSGLTKPLSVSVVE